MTGMPEAALAKEMTLKYAVCGFLSQTNIGQKRRMVEIKSDDIFRHFLS